MELGVGEFSVSQGKSQSGGQGWNKDGPEARRTSTVIQESSLEAKQKGKGGA